MKAKALLFLPLFFVAFSVLLTTKAQAQIPQPLLYLSFEGADPWQDQSDAANAVSVSGNVLGVPTGALNGPSPSGGASFTGGHLKIPGIHALNDLQQYTMTAWLKPDRDNDAAERYVFGQESQGIHNGIRNNMYLHHAHWGSDQNGGTDLKGYFANTATDGWIHATWTWDRASTTGQIYLDGVLDGQWNKNPPNVGNTMIIGGRNGGTQQYLGLMDEVAIWNSVLDSDAIAALADGAPPVDAADEDEDTLPDWWETKYAGDLTTLNGLAGDFDEDGLTDYDEYENGTDPTEEDTDADGLEDNLETNTGTFASASDTGTNPVVADTDGDGLSDGAEVLTHETNPHLRDTDGDGASDGAEITAGTDPLDEDSKPDVQLVQPSFPTIFDLPLGAGFEANFTEPGLMMQENHYPVGVMAHNNTNQNWDRVVVNPENWPPTRTKTQIEPYFDHGPGGFNTPGGGNRPYIDGGGDHFSIRVDGYVELEAGDYTIHLGADDTNYFVIDTPDGPRQTGHNCCPNNHTMTFNISMKSLCPFSNLMVEEGGGDWGDVSITGPGFARVALGDVVGGSPPVYTIQPASVDADNDLLTDWWENNHVGNLTDLTGDGIADFDEDGLSDFKEFENGTDPTEKDTDGDGLDDNVETNTGSFVSATDTGTDPTVVDTDGDGLDDGEEFAEPFSDPTDPDDPPPPPFEQDLVGRWTFDPGEELVDKTGNFPDLVLQGNAMVVDGALDVNGGGTNSTGWAYTAGNYSGPVIADKTLVSWFRLESLENVVKAGSVITLDKVSADQFDGIIFAERQSNRWMNGSSNFSRTQDWSPGFAEIAVGEPIMMAITYEDIGGNQVRVTGYRNGDEIGSYVSGSFATWPTNDAEVLFGLRHGSAGSGPGGIDALIDEARIYGRAGSAAQIRALFNAGPGGRESLQITDIGANFGGASPVVTISFNSQNGRVYAVDRTTDLLIWEELDDGVVGEEESTDFIDDFLPEGSKIMFYRVREVE